MKSKQTTKLTIMDAAKALAHSHKCVDPGTTLIICYSKDDDSIIKLLEVSKEVPPSDSVFAVNFAAGNGITYPSSIILLNPRDFNKVKAGKLALPDGWGDVTAGNTLLGKALIAK